MICRAVGRGHELDGPELIVGDELVAVEILHQLEADAGGCQTMSALEMVVRDVVKHVVPRSLRRYLWRVVVPRAPGTDGMRVKRAAAEVAEDVLLPDVNVTVLEIAEQSMKQAVVNGGGMR